MVSAYDKLKEGCENYCPCLCISAFDHFVQVFDMKAAQKLFAGRRARELSLSFRVADVIYCVVLLIENNILHRYMCVHANRTVTVKMVNEKWVLVVAILEFSGNKIFYDDVGRF